MTTGREVLTLQFGNYSNYVGTHWWNIQESSFDYNKIGDVNHDVLFREGQNFKGETTFTPRLILVDLKGSLVPSSVCGNLYEDLQPHSSSNVLWDSSKVEAKNVANDSEKHEFIEDLDSVHQGNNLNLETKDYKFSETVNQWCDYSRTLYHPRTISIIDDYYYGDTNKPFDVFNLGAQAYSSSFQEEFSEKVRCYIEECDNLDGFQILVDADDGFGGLCSSSLQMLEDEYSNKPRLLFSIIPNTYSDQTPMKDVVRMINILLSLEKMSEHSSLCVPLSINQTCWRTRGNPIVFPHFTYQDTKYDTSSILAAAIDTLTLRYRSANDYVSMSEITSSLSIFGRKVAAGSIGLPFSLLPGSYLLDTLEKMDESLWTGLTPGCQVQDDRIWVQSVVLRGLPQSKLRNPDLRFEGSNPAYTCTNIKEMLTLFLSFCSYATLSGVSAVESPLKTSTPFPQLFSKHVSRYGSVDPNSERVNSFKVESVPVIAGLHSCKSLGNMLQSLVDIVKKVKIKRFHQFVECGMDEDEYATSVENLSLLRQCYNEEFDV